MAQVRLKNIVKKFGDVLAVKEVSLDIVEKEFLVLVGPSGCGKTTTLRMIAGLEEPTSGEIYIGDRMVIGVPPKDRNIAMVFQNYALYPHMTVYENMAFGLKLRKYSKKEIEERVNEAAAILNIEKYLKRKPRQLSGGQRQRVAVGRAIVRKPMVFLFDEPLSNLDAKFRVQMRAELNKLHERLQTTMIYVTHDQTEAMSLGDRIVVMKDGVIQQVADPITLYDQPANKFVAGFIGSPPMNFMPGKINKKNGSYYFNNDAFKLKIPDEMKSSVVSYDGKDVIFGVRSEDIYDKLFATLKPPEHTIIAQVEVVEPMGSETFLYLRKGAYTFIAKVGAHNKPKTNQNMELIFDMKKTHFFDPETEKTIV
ncbi:MAG: sn-glycerol-3-phosphate ABC transporter ATP-binding protein UgpC [Candidatus Omnitrophica bacterium]|nr:sn-glycerol-3-phosphate ABC transporter ATP-binding protein UgpC [Candidatus Omnitrophota bacterium]MBU4478356.1 sn-glycerol-3-phosphate ABC transporter ATP-binding protein UgpC [Candidatus Omnitrophota bacterium]